MQEAMHSLSDAMTPPPEMMLGPRRILAWCILAVCVVVMRLAVKLLPHTSPLRIFVEGSTAMMRDAVSPSRYFSAPAPSRLRGS